MAAGRDIGRREAFSLVRKHKQTTGQDEVTYLPAPVHTPELTQ